MPKVKVVNQAGVEVEKIKLSDEVFAITPNMQTVFDVVYAQRAAMRQGTSSTKNRVDVRGGGAKPWRQKGTGRARHGSNRSPLWRGGGVTFGPTPRSYNVKVNKKVVQIALKSLLSDRLANNKLVVVDKIELEGFKTKGLVEVLTALNASGKIVVITTEEDFNLLQAGRNIPNVYVQTKDHLSVYDMINADMYIATKDAVTRYEEELK